MGPTYNNEKGKEFWAAATSGVGKYKPKTRLHVSFPPGDNIKLLNFAEISAPAGVTITFNLPFPMSEAGLSKLVEAINNVGGTMEFDNKEG